jgi:hypothetical protein
MKRSVSCPQNCPWSVLSFMNLEIRAALKEILRKVAHWKDSTTDLVCFYPMRGSCADGRLMLVGRALNGWNTKPFKAPEMELEAGRNNILENTLETSSSNPGCPIRGLHDSWRAGLKSKRSRYNPERSSFWCVAREVIKEFGVPEEKEKWENYLYWTNLYKISPLNTGNPSGSLKRLVEPACRKMLTMEVEFLLPQRILFLTGQLWANPFLPDLNYVSQKTATYTRVHETGFCLLSNGSKAAVVVADHPERKKRSVIVSEIVDAFSKLERGSLW